MIHAEVHSDNHVAEANFDAAGWFKQATDQQITDLAECGWGGDYPADVVARSSGSRKVKKVFAYLDTVRGTEIGFECHVNKDDARRWIARNRPWLMPMCFPMNGQRKAK